MFLELQQRIKLFVSGIYENDVELDLFKEEVITLEKLYQQVVEDNENESVVM